MMGLLGGLLSAWAGDLGGLCPWSYSARFPSLLDGCVGLVGDVTWGLVMGDTWKSTGEVVRVCGEIGIRCDNPWIQGTSIDGW